MRPSPPQGYRVSGVHCGIKSNPEKPDLSLFVSSADAVAAGVYTQNQICASPVTLDRERTPSGNIRAVVVNSGNANACTGQQGWQDTLRMTEITAGVCGIDPSQVLVMSTGIIGEPMPMAKIESGIREASNRLDHTADALDQAANGILTTDLVTKVCSRAIPLPEGHVQITGVAKGSGMIAPHMATMLGLILTDARLLPEEAQAMLLKSSSSTFNCVSVDGHTSTNDTVLLLANGKAMATTLSDPAKGQFAEALTGVCETLAQSIAEDGEGATHTIEVRVLGCVSWEDAQTIARTIANSPLVKTAIAGCDPNWGRIVSAAGYAGPRFDPSGVSLRLNDTWLFQRGLPVPFNAEAVSQSMRDRRVVTIELSLEEGDANGRHWTSDLTAEYVRINADYHT